MEGTRVCIYNVNTTLGPKISGRAHITSKKLIAPIELFKFIYCYYSITIIPVIHTLSGAKSWR